MRNSPFTREYTFAHLYGPTKGQLETVTMPAHAGGMKSLLGLDPKKHFPVEGMPPQTIQGFQVYVTPKPNDGRLKHRVIAICTCGKHVPAGRMFQHKCK